MKKVLCWSLSSTKEILLPFKGKQSDQPRVMQPVKGRAAVQIQPCLAAKCLPAHHMAGPISDGRHCWSTVIQDPLAQLRSPERVPSFSQGCLEWGGGPLWEGGIHFLGTREGGDLIFSEHSF